MPNNPRAWLVLIVLAGAPASVAAQDTAAQTRDAIGLPMRPSDAAAGSWTLQTGGQVICTLTLSADRSPSGIYGATIPSACASALPPDVVGWKPVTDGMALVGPDGRSMVDFNQWTPRDLAARRPGAPALELTRPKSAP